MSKSLKFRQHLSTLVLNGEKTTTWRFFDDKNIQPQDTVVFLIWETGQEFAQANIIEVKEKALKDLSEQDWDGHEKFASEEEMYETYTRYYKQPVDQNTLVKIIKFELTKR